MGSSLLINKKDILLINEFVNGLGIGDVDYEVNNISYYENIFDENRRLSKEKLNTDGKMYLKLIIGVGLAICIMLI